MKPAILAIDDDVAICELLNDMLSEHVFTVYTCHQGYEGLSLLQQHPDIALVLLDLVLPDTNGLLVLQQLQRLRPDLLVIMLSGLGAESDIAVGLEMGADDYIAKPFTPRGGGARQSGASPQRRAGAGLPRRRRGRRLAVQRLAPG